MYKNGHDADLASKSFLSGDLFSITFAKELDTSANKRQSALVKYTVQITSGVGAPGYCCWRNGNIQCLFEVRGEKLGYN